MKKGLLVMHYGTPSSEEDILPYYTHIRRGRAPSPEQLADLTMRYGAIGGPSPLNAVSVQQGEAIQAGLRRRGVDADLYIGAKHNHPFVAETVEKMAHDGVDEAVGIVLAPHYSSFSIAAYKKYAIEAKEKTRPNMKIDIVERWGADPAFIQALCDRVLAEMVGWDPNETLVIFSAHSLPEKIMADGDPYQSELMETSRLVAEATAIPHWTFAFQSASQTGEPWLGPDVLDVIAAEGVKYCNVLCCTVGFVCDHLEVLYDLGIEARDKCAELGLNFKRAATIGADQNVMDSLAQTVADRFAKLSAE